MTDHIHEGGCMCGEVRYRAAGEPVRVGLCHCVTCRRNTGAPVAAFAIFPRGAVTVLSGEVGRHASSATMVRCFCRACGSPVFQEEGEEINVYLGSLDAPEALPPSYELWSTRRLPWLPEMPELDAFARNRLDP